MSALEILGFVTGGICVFLQVRQNVWGWPIGITNNVAYSWSSGRTASTPTGAWRQ